MNWTRSEVESLAERILKYDRPLQSPTFRDIELMARGDRVFDGMSGYLRDTYYPGKPDEFFVEVISEVKLRVALRMGTK